MRWKVRFSTCQLGDVRTVRRFLIIPKRLGDEWRWLEFAFIEQKFEKAFDAECEYYKDKWAGKRFVDKED